MWETKRQEHQQQYQRQVEQQVQQEENEPLEESVLVQEQIDISGDIDEITQQVKELGEEFTMSQSHLLKLLSSLSRQYEKLEHGEELDDDWVIL